MVWTTGDVTRICAGPDLPSTVAVIVLVPAATADTRPVASRSSAPPTTSATVAGVTLTDAIGEARTMTAANPVRPSACAIITTLPIPTAVTTPAEDTVARLGDPLLHVTAGAP